MVGIENVLINIYVHTYVRTDVCMYVCMYAQTDTHLASCEENQFVMQPNCSHADENDH